MRFARITKVSPSPPPALFKTPDMGTQSKYVLRLPLSLKTGAEQVAREDGTTLNQFIVSAVVEMLAAMKTVDYCPNAATRMPHWLF